LKLPNAEYLFHPLEDCIREGFIPAVTGHLPRSDLERDFLALPTRIGGMGIINPIRICAFEYTASTKLSYQAFAIPSVISNQHFLK